jgi:hypothetical protein
MFNITKEKNIFVLFKWYLIYIKNHLINFCIWFFKTIFDLIKFIIVLPFIYATLPFIAIWYLLWIMTLKPILKIIKYFFIFSFDIFIYWLFFALPIIMCRAIYEFLYQRYGHTITWKYYEEQFIKIFGPIKVFFKRRILIIPRFFWAKWKTMTITRMWLLLIFLFYWVFFVIFPLEQVFSDAISRTGEYYWYRYWFKPVVHPTTVLLFFMSLPIWIIWLPLEWYKWKYPEAWLHDWSDDEDFDPKTLINSFMPAMAKEDIQLQLLLEKYSLDNFYRNLRLFWWQKITKPLKISIKTKIILPIKILLYGKKKD